MYPVFEPSLVGENVILTIKLSPPAIVPEVGLIVNCGIVDVIEYTTSGVDPVFRILVVNSFGLPICTVPYNKLPGYREMAL